MNLDDDLTEEELANLAEKGTGKEKRAVAKHPNASLTTLLFLSENGFAEEVDQNPMILLHAEAGSDEVVKILEKVAEQTQRGERLEELASSVWDDVRYAVSKNANTPTIVLSTLVKDQDEYVRRSVARNASTPPETLSILASDQDDMVRRRVAENTNTPMATLSILAKDKEIFIRRGVAENRSTPMTTLYLLVDDKVWSVRDAAMTTLNNPDDDK